jgi:hypothetical protein
MQKELNVIIVEDDPYARDFMSMLLRRDWRTQVVGEFSSLSGYGIYRLPASGKVPHHPAFLSE